MASNRRGAPARRLISGDGRQGAPTAVPRGKARGGLSITAAQASAGGPRAKASGAKAPAGGETAAIGTRQKATPLDRAAVARMNGRNGP